MDNEVKKDNFKDEEDHKKKDHYHDEHHFDKIGNHDDVSPRDFELINSFRYSKKNLIFKMTSTSIFLAIALMCTFFDTLLERFAIPVYGVYISLRYLDITIILISLPLLGPLFSSLIAFIVPWIHLLMDPVHGPIVETFDSISYFLMVWVMWIFYYAIFKNSFIHKETTKKHNFKAWLPLPFVVIMGAILFTGSFILSAYLNSLSASHGHAQEHTLFHEEGGEEHHHFEWDEAIPHIGIIATILFIIELVRLSIIYVLFVVLEHQFKKINHRFW